VSTSLQALPNPEDLQHRFDEMLDGFGLSVKYLVCPMGLI
jgi:hypothetical protein